MFRLVAPGRGDGVRAALMAHDSTTSGIRLRGRGSRGGGRPPASGAGGLPRYIFHAARAWLGSLVTVRGLVGAAGAAPRAAHRAKMPARAAGVVLSEASRDTSPAVRAWLRSRPPQTPHAARARQALLPWKY